MAGTQNLIPMNERTKEEQKEIATKGGKASGEARRRKKTMRENLEILLAMPLKKGKAADIDKGKNLQEFTSQNLTVEQAMLLAQIKKAMKGDLYSFEAIRDLIGEAPVKRSEVNASVQHTNPFEGLSTDDLKKLIDDE